MWDQIELRLVRALREAARERLGETHPFLIACAASTLNEIRMQLGELSTVDGDRLLADAHRRLREDPAAWLEHWGPARPN